MFRNLQKRSLAFVVACGALNAFSPPHVAHMGELHQPSFGKENTRNKSLRDQRKTKITKNSIVLIAGSGNPSIAESVSNLIDVPLADVILAKFNDGECNIKILSDVRGKHVYIVQSCAAPVNDSVLELLLLISCARRAGAKRITAVIRPPSTEFGSKQALHSHQTDCKGIVFLRTCTDSHFED